MLPYLASAVTLAMACTAPVWAKTSTETAAPTAKQEAAAPLKNAPLSNAPITTAAPTKTTDKAPVLAQPTTPKKDAKKTDLPATK